MSESDGFEWAIVEIFGHRRHAGRIREEERFGAKMLRVEVPLDGDPEKRWATHWYGGAAIFSLTPTDEATALRMNRPYAPGRLLLEEPENEEDDTLDDYAEDDLDRDTDLDKSEVWP